MNNGLKSIAGPAIVAALLLVALPGCSMLRLGYGQFDAFALWTANDYFELNPAQRHEFSRRFDRIHSWHRYEQLPEYVAFLGATRARLQNGITREDVLWVIDGVKNRFRTIVRHGAEDAAAMLLTVTPEQLHSLKARWDRDNRRFAQEHRIHGSPQEQRDAALKRMRARISEWTGSLSNEQEAKIAVILGEGPFIHPHRYEDRLRRQREFLQLMSQRGDARRFTGRLRHWLAHWEEGRDPEYARLFHMWEQKLADFYVAVAEMLTPQQHAAAVRRIQGYMDDFTRLAQRPEAQADASR